MLALGRVALAILGVVIIIGLVTSISYTTATEVVPAAGGTYVEALVGRPGPLNPLTAPANRSASDLASLVFSGLTTRDENGHIAPALAERWEVSPDARTFTFLLNSRATWHDGTPVTADDVVFTVRMLQSDEYPMLLWLRDMWRGVSAEKISERIVRLVLPEAYAPFLEYTTIGLLPAHILEGRGEGGKEVFEAKPIGTGPYRVVEITDNDVLLEAFPGYDGPKPMIPRLLFRFYSDRPSALAALRSGHVMGLADLTPTEAASLAQESNITTYWAPSAGQTAVLFNLSLPFFDNADTRRALLSAIDREALINKVLAGKAVPTTGPFLPQSWAYKRDLPSWPYSPDTARSLLAKAGWRDRDGDGILEREGIKFEFGLLTSDDPLRVAVAQEVARAWVQVGASVEVLVVNATGLVSDYLQPRAFEAVLFGWSLLPDDPDPYELWHSSQRSLGGQNFTGLASQRVDELIEEARRSGDPVRRTLLYAQFQDIFAEQLPALFLYQPMYGMAVSRDVKQVRLSYITEPGDRFRHIAEWYTMTRTITITERQRVR